MGRAIFPSETSPAAQYMSTLRHKAHDLWKKKLSNLKCVLIFSIYLSEIILIIIIIIIIIIKQYIGAEKLQQIGNI